MRLVAVLALMVGASTPLLAQQCREIQGTRQGTDVCCNSIKLVSEEGAPLRNTSIVVKRAKIKFVRPHVTVVMFVRDKTVLRTRTDADGVFAPQIPADSYFIDAKRDGAHVSGTLYFFDERDRQECRQELKMWKDAK